jgi:6-phosphofructokinase 1
MKTIAVFTSGGDAPGMNACLRAVVRTAAFNGIKVKGILNGYDGMIADNFIDMDASAVANIIHKGGTILKTARSKSFFTKAGQQKAKANLTKNKIDGVVVIGGDGSFKGALEFSKMCKIPFVGCPGTIDNDLVGTDYTIGYDTAINTVIDAVDKIRDTAESHGRVFFVEVMGRDAGLIALRSGLASGAEAILIPEIKTNINALIKKLKSGRKEKKSKIVIVSEHDDAGGAFKISEKIKLALPEIDIRVSVLGHIQRGGKPSCMDRVNASRMGYAAVQALLGGKKHTMIGIVNNKITFTPFAKAVKHLQQPHPDLVQMMEILS